MEIHIDDEHGKITDLTKLLSRTKGCGFLGVSDSVVEILKELNLTYRFIAANEKRDFVQNIFTHLQRAGAKIIVLEGNHANNAQIIINQIPNYTYPKDILFHEAPAFCWDMWATTNNKVYEEFLKAGNLSKEDLSLEQFINMQLAMHFATAMLLRVARIGQDGNVFCLSMDSNDKTSAS